MEPELLFECMSRYIGKTVTIFTKSGGLSGSGFTGVLVAIDRFSVSLITRIGAAPACCLGGSCTGPVGDYGPGYYGGNWLGAVTEIPICSTICHKLDTVFQRCFYGVKDGQVSECECAGLYCVIEKGGSSRL